MDRLGMSPETYKPWMTFCEGHLRADQSKIGGLSKKIEANVPKKSLTFISTLVKVSTSQKTDEDSNMSIVMQRKQNVASESGIRLSAFSLHIIICG